MLQKCEGIVIRTNDYGENNKIVTLFTKEFGKVGVMARGAKKPSSRLTSITQLFTYAQFLIQHSHRGLGTLQQGELITSMRKIREDIYRTAYATYILELTDRSVEEKKQNPFLFQLLFQTLQYMNEEYDLEILMFIYEMKMLNVLGLYPQLNQCVSCDNQDGQFDFSIRENGLICYKCFHRDPYRLKLSASTIKLLRLFYYFDLNRLGTISVKDETKKELKKAISLYYDEYSGVYIKSKRFLEQIDHLRKLL